MIWIINRIKEEVLTNTTSDVYKRQTLPEASDAYVVVDAFDRGSYVKVIPEENKIVGYTTRNSGGVPQEGGL